METSTLERVDWMYLNIAASKHCPVSLLELEKLPLADFLRIEDFVKIMQDFERAAQMDEDAKPKEKPAK